MKYISYRQHTIQQEVCCEGLGLHSGAKVCMSLKPAPPDFGVRFCRLDVAERPVITARHDRVVDTLLATTIGFDGVVVSTIEHLMAAFLGTRVDNVLVELDGPEVPVFDGSAAAYVEIIKASGLKEQRAPRRCLKIKRPLVVREGDAYVRAVPSDTFHVHYTIDFPHPLVGRQELSWRFEESAFAREIANARTFGFLKDVKRLQSMGLAQGGSLANVIVFDDHNVLNGDGFRFADECVRHKILDFIGDLALTGVPVLGHFEAHKAGHALHNRFLRELAAESESCAVLTSCFLAPSFLRNQSPNTFTGSLAASAKAI